jgi:hypothetical protein
MTETAYQPNVFLDLIVAFLAPMFLAVTGGNVSHARAAAVETVNAYRAENHVDLLTVAQIIAFGIAALGSLSLSMADNLSVSLILRLRGNAVSANRAAEQCRRALARPKIDPASYLPPVHDDPFPAEATIIANVAQLRAQTAPQLRAQTAPQLRAQTAPQLRAQTAPQLRAQTATVTPPEPVPSTPARKPATVSPADAVWANAMIEVAAEITAGMPGLPPGERRGASIQAAALSDVARDILAGNPSQMPAGLNLSPSAGPA